MLGWVLCVGSVNADITPVEPLELAWHFWQSRLFEDKLILIKAEFTN